MKNNMKLNFVKINLVIIFFLLFFGASAEYGAYAQMASVILLVVQAAKIVNRDSTVLINSRTEVLSFVLIIVMPVFSIVNGIFRGDLYPVGYGVLFLFAALAVKIIVDRFGVLLLVDSYINAALLAGVIFSGLEFEMLYASLSGTMTDSGIMRFTPYEIHPNLIAHQFAPAVAMGIILLYNSKKTVKRLNFALAIPVALLMVVASGSRGGLFAIFLALAVAMVRQIAAQSLQKAIFIVVAFFAIAITLMISLSGTGFMDSPADFLALDSEQRGLASGMSGRTDAWPYVIAKIVDDGWAVFSGFGFRSWDLLVEGFPIDSSYVEIAHDFGFFLSFCLLILILKRFFDILKASSVEGIELVAIFIFFLSESVVARYMLGLGNPASLLFLAVLLFDRGKPNFEIDFVNDSSQKSNQY